MDAEHQHRELLLNNDIIITVGEIFRKSFMERFHWFDEQYDLLEDYPFWLRITEEGVKIPFLDKKVAKYRISATSVRNPEKIHPYIMCESQKLQKEIFTICD